MKSWLLLLGGFWIGTAWAQREVDSIRRVLPGQQGRERIQSLNELSWYYASSYPDSAVWFSSEALSLSRQLQDEAAIAASLNSLGITYQNTGKYDSALQYFASALAIRQNRRDSLDQAKILNNIGICYDELADFERATQHYFEALQLSEKLSDLNTQAIVLGNIGIIYKKQKDFENAWVYYERATEIYRKLGNEFGVVVNTGNVSSVFQQMGLYTEALQYAASAESGYRKLGYARYIPYMQSIAALCYDSLGKADSAAHFYHAALNAHRAIGNRYEMAFLYKNLGSFYLRQNEYAPALSYADSALVLSRQMEAREFAKDALYVKASILAKQGNGELAFQTLLGYTSLKDSLFEENKTRQIFQLQTVYETGKKAQQIALQQAEIAEEQAKNRQKLLVILGLLMFAVLLAVVAVLIRSSASKKQKLLLQESEIRLREAQLSSAIRSQEKERSRFAKDLHDGFGQMISLLQLHLSGLGSRASDRHQIFEQSTKVLDEMYKELKAICFNLMPQTLIQHGLDKAVMEFAEKVNRAGKLQVKVHIFGLNTRLTDVQEISLYRIVQEWINNILKYSDATVVDISVTCDTEELTLLIEDNGRGFDPTLLTDGKGNGWRNMNSRANLIRASLELDTRPGVKGTALIANVPLHIPQTQEMKIPL